MCGCWLSVRTLVGRRSVRVKLATRGVIRLGATTTRGPRLGTTTAHNEMSRRNKAADLGDRSHRCPPAPAAEASGSGPGTLDRNRVIRGRLPLRDHVSIGLVPGETQYHLSPNSQPGR